MAKFIVRTLLIWLLYEFAFIAIEAAFLLGSALDFIDAIVRIPPLGVPVKCIEFPLVTLVRRNDITNVVLFYGAAALNGAIWAFPLSCIVGLVRSRWRSDRSVIRDG
jgi:hypothetical protein